MLKVDPHVNFCLVGRVACDLGHVVRGHVDLETRLLADAHLREVPKASAVGTEAWVVATHARIVSVSGLSLWSAIENILHQAGQHLLERTTPKRLFTSKLMAPVGRSRFFIWIMQGRSPWSPPLCPS